MTEVQVDEHPAVTPVLWALGAFSGALVVVWHVTPCTDVSVKPAASVLRYKRLNTEANSFLQYVDKYTKLHGVTSQNSVMTSPVKLGKHWIGTPRNISV